MLIGLAITISSCSQKTYTPSANVPNSKEQNRPPKGQRGSQPQFTDLLRHMDTNKDGKLAKDEVRGPIQNDFAMLDKDKDGFITESEFLAAPKRQRPSR